MEKVIVWSDFEKKGKSLVFRSGAKQVFVVEVAGKVFALDNRCPHEGYPLSQGKSDEKSCVLTCNWHNWKFDLATGRCLLGEDNVRTYPVHVRDGQIKIDLSDLPPQVVRDNILNDFRVAFENREYGRMSREITRMLYNDFDPLCVLNKAIIWSYQKFEFGTTHAYAAAADWVSLYHDCNEREEKIICLTEAIDYMAVDSLRHKDYEYQAAAEQYDEEELLEAIEGRA